MRFMIMVPASKESEAGVLPDEASLLAMGKFNEEMVKAGVMRAGEGLHASARGAKVAFLGGGKTQVVDGPFTESKEIIGGYAIVQADTRERAMEIAQEFVDLHLEHWPGFEFECEIRPQEAM